MRLFSEANLVESRIRNMDCVATMFSEELTYNVARELRTLVECE